MSKHPTDNVFAKRPASDEEIATKNDDTTDDDTPDSEHGGSGRSGSGKRSDSDDSADARRERAEDRQRDGGTDPADVRDTGIQRGEGGSDPDGGSNPADEFILGQQISADDAQNPATPTAEEIADQFGRGGDAAGRVGRELHPDHVDTDALLHPDIGTGTAEDLLRGAGARDTGGHYGTGGDIFEVGDESSRWAVANLGTEPSEAEWASVQKMLDIGQSVQDDYNRGNISETERLKQMDAVHGGIQNVQSTYRPEDVYVQETGSDIGKNLSKGNFLQRTIGDWFGVSDKKSPQDHFRHEQTGDQVTRDTLPDNAIEKDGRSTIKEQSEQVQFDDLPNRGANTNALRDFWDRYKPSGTFDQEKAAREQAEADAAQAEADAAKASADAFKARADAERAADDADAAAAEPESDDTNADGTQTTGEDDIITGEQAAATAEMLANMGLGELLQKRDPRDGAIDPGEEGSEIDVTGGQRVDNSGGIEQPTGEAAGAASQRTNPRDHNIDPKQDDVEPVEGGRERDQEVGLQNDDLSHLNPENQHDGDMTLTQADMDLMDRTVHGLPVDDMSTDEDPALLDAAGAKAAALADIDPAVLDGEVTGSPATPPDDDSDAAGSHDDDFGAPVSDPDLVEPTVPESTTAEDERRAEQEKFAESEEAIILTPVDNSDDSSSDDPSEHDDSGDATADEELPDDIED